MKSGILSLIFLFFHLVLYAQTPFIKNYSVKDGLPSNETYEVFQDSKGFIWVGTDKGVAKFDGYKFDVFTSDQGLGDNVVFGFYEDYAGRIWFRCFNGSLCYYLDGKIYKLACSDLFRKQINNSIITSFYVDKQEKLWVGLSLSDYFIVDLKTQGFKKQNTFDKIGCAGYIIEFYNGYIWGSNWLENSEGINNKYLIFILNHNNKVLSKIDISTTKKKHAHSYFGIKKSGNKYYYFTTNSIIGFDNKNTFNVNTIHSSILSINKIGNQFFYGLEFDGVLSGEMSFLKGNSITSVMQDFEKGYWFSSLERGIYYVSNFYFNQLQINKEDYNHEISSIEFFKNDLLLGTKNGYLINLKNKETITFTDLNFDNKIDNSINSIKSFENGKFLVNSYRTVVFYDNQFHVLKNKKQDKIYSKEALIFSDKYALISKNIVYYYDVYNNSLKESTTFSSSRLNQGIIKDGRIVLAASDGLWTIENNSPKKIRANNDSLNFRIDALAADKNGNIYLSSKGKGLFLLRNNWLYNLSINTPSKFYNTLFLEKENILWAAQNKGLIKINFTSYRPLLYQTEFFTEKQGLPNCEINQIKEKDGQLYLATNLGLLKFDYSSYQVNKTKPPVYISGIHINNKVESSLKKNYSLPHYDNNIKINFVGLSYKDAGNILYKYRLLGLDSNWHQTSYTQINYSALPYGQYTFEVLAQNNDGIWSKNPATIQISINPPFWHTWWFRILYMLGLFALVYFFVNKRILYIKKKEQEKADFFKKSAEMEKEKAELFRKAAEMELKFLSSQMNPHFTFNSMNAIQYFLMRNETKSAQNYLIKYSKLIRLVLENSMENEIQLSREVNMIRLYLEIEAMRFPEKFNFQINIQSNVDSDSLKIPPMIIQPYVENAIWHGIMNKTNGVGEIIIEFSCLDKFMMCSVEDNGIGRKMSKEIGLNKNKKSMGMLISNQRIEKMHSHLNNNQAVNIVDKIDQAGNSLGTRVEIVLPLIT